MISFVVPAHNEETVLGRTLAAIHEAGRAVGQPYEIVVADDASTDSTSQIAEGKGARVVHVAHRQIAATRNSGASAARGERIFFVDADTIVNARVVASALHAMDEGASGGGAAAWIDRNEVVPLYIRVIMAFAAYAPKLVGFTGGAFMFCTREAFVATGGFNERLYWAEEGGFAMALKRQGRFFVPWQPVMTSGRRFRKINGLQLMGGAVQMVLSPRKFFTQRASVEKVWYDSDRSDDDKMPTSWGVRVSNAIVLLILLIVISSPLFDFIPGSWTPLSSPLGKYRFTLCFFLCPVGALGWMVGLALLVNVLRQKRWTGLIQSTALIAFCFWQAWNATLGVIDVWAYLLR